jgi:hypothetical protein
MRDKTNSERMFPTRINEDMLWMSTNAALIALTRAWRRPPHSHKPGSIFRDRSRFAIAASVE